MKRKMKHVCSKCSKLKLKFFFFHFNLTALSKTYKDYIKNSSVEWDSDSQVRIGRSKIDISMTRSPRYVGSVN